MFILLLFCFFFQLKYFLQCFEERIIMIINKSINRLEFFDNQVYSMPFISCGPIPILEAILSWDAAASRNENKWTISISDLANLMALLNKSIAITKLPLKKSLIN